MILQLKLEKGVNVRESQVSIVITVLNERRNIGSLLSNLIEQGRVFDEIIIVDM